MKRTKILLAAILGLSAALATLQASAQGFYIGASFGSSDFDKGNVIPDLMTTGNVDGKDSGTKLFGGYQVNRNLGLELAYADLGKTNYGPGSSGPCSVTNGTVKASGFNFSAVGTLPLNPSFDLFGKIGFYAWEAKANDTTCGAPFSDKATGTDLSYGVGATYNLTKNFGIRAEWEQYKAVDDISLLSIGVAYKF